MVLLHMMLLHTLIPVKIIKKIDQFQHISSCGKFLLCSGQHYLFICEYSACSSLRNAFLFVKD